MMTVEFITALFYEVDEQLPMGVDRGVGLCHGQCRR